jgi:hypothetical protein
MTEPAYKIDTLLNNALTFLSQFSRANLMLSSSKPVNSVEQLQPPPRRNELSNLTFWATHCMTFCAEYRRGYPLDRMYPVQRVASH